MFLLDFYFKFFVVVLLVQGIDFKFKFFAVITELFVQGFFFLYTIFHNQIFHLVGSVYSNFCMALIFSNAQARMKHQYIFK